MKRIIFFLLLCFFCSSASLLINPANAGAFCLQDDGQEFSEEKPDFEKDEQDNPLRQVLKKDDISIRIVKNPKPSTGLAIGFYSGIPSITYNHNNQYSLLAGIAIVNQQVNGIVSLKSKIFSFNDDNTTVNAGASILYVPRQSAFGLLAGIEHFIGSNISLVANIYPLQFKDNSTVDSGIVRIGANLYLNNIIQNEKI